MPTDNLKQNLSAAADVIVSNASSGPTLSWAEYKSQKPTDGATVNLTQADFNAGTLRITTGNCVFKINSDIIRLVELLYVQFPLDPRLIGFAWQF